MRQALESYPGQLGQISSAVAPLQRQAPPEAHWVLALAGTLAELGTLDTDAAPSEGSNFGLRHLQIRSSSIQRPASF